MWNNRKLAALLALWVWTSSGADGLRAGDVTIEMKTGPLSVTNRLITIDDVAHVSGTNESTVKRIRKLDLEFLEHSFSATITRSQIQMRIRVADALIDNLNFSGGQTVTVTLSNKAENRAVIESAVAKAVAGQFAVPVEDVRTRLLNGNDQTLSAIAQSIDTVWFNFPTALPYGQVKVKVEYADRRGDVVSTELHFSFSILMDLVIVKKQLSRGTVISTQHIARVKRPVSEPNLVPVSYQDCLGKTVASDIPIHSILRVSHVASRRRGTLVKRNDLIDVVVRKPGFQMRLKNAKALTSGSHGDTIQILSPGTDRKIAAVVVEDGLAEIR